MIISTEEVAMDPRKSAHEWLEFFSAITLLALSGFATGWTIWANQGNGRVMYGAALTFLAMVVGCFRAEPKLLFPGWE
jgi:hypothetical protein